MKKLRFRLIMMELVFLIIVIGGGTMLYSIFGPSAYKQHKADVIRNAYEDIRDTDLSNMDTEFLDLLMSYEVENLLFTITDEEFNTIYASRKNNSDAQNKSIIMENLDRFSEDPQVITRDSKSKYMIKLRGICEQNNEKYYVLIRENLISAQSSFSYTERFLVNIFFVSVLVGSVTMFWFSRRIAKPIENIADVSKKMAQHDFSIRAKENAEYEEVTTLARNFNSMADQVTYYIAQLEENNNKLEQANDYLTDQNSQKRRMEQARKEFIANISHELKTPLAVISSQVDMLECMGDRIDKGYYYESLHEEIEKMSEMISNLLQLSFMEYNLEKMEKVSLDVTEILEYLKLKYDALLSQKKLKVHYMMEENCIVFGNRSYLEQAINNYIINAFEHTSEGNNILISLKKEEKQVVLRVFNEGDGIENDRKNKIWDNYYQRHAEKENSDSNAGLGLYIVKTIINIHGGSYGAENREKGVEFWFSLPEYK